MWEVIPQSLTLTVDVDYFVSGVKKWLVDGDVGII